MINGPIGRSLLNIADKIDLTEVRMNSPRPMLAALRKAYRNMEYWAVDDWYAQPMAAGLINIITRASGLGNPEAVVGDGVYEHKSGFYESDFMCVSAEPNFSRLLGFIANPDLEIADTFRREDHTATVYLDKGNKPIALQKSIEIGSALSLTRVTLGGVLLPAGTILNIGSSDEDSVDSSLVAGGEINGFSCEIRYIEGMGITPLRASPWAYENSSLDRSLFACGTGIDGKPKINEIAKQYAVARQLDDFRTGAGRVMEACGIGV